MIITCEKCDTKFLVKAEQLGENGRKVRCGSCAHIWLQTPAEPEVVKEENAIAQKQEENLKKAAEDKAKGVTPSLPVVVEAKPVPRWLQAVAAVLLLVNILVFVAFNKDMIGHTPFYDMIGQYETEGVIIADAEIGEPVAGKKGNIYEIDWSVENTTKGTMELPTRRIRVLDKAGEQVTGGTDEQPMSLKPGQKLEFEKNRVENSGNKGKYLVIELGNPHELAIR